MEDIKDHKIKIVKPQLGGQERFTRSNVDVCFFGGSLGGGKELSINELVLTPYGWKRNGDLKEGDIISTPFGKPTKILQVFPHSNKDIYVLRTSDGRECQCGLEHLWEVRTTKQIHNYRKHYENRNFSVLTTQELIDGMAKGTKYFIPIPKAQEFGEKTYDVDPYILGKTIDLGGRIDDRYKFGSIRQRTRLLNGLAEGKGVCERDGTSGFIEYRVKDDGLTEDVIYILRSLGYAPTIPVLKNGYNYFFIDKYSDHVLIESITYKCKEDALCILVEDKDHLYIAGDFLTTHNTFGAILSMAEPLLDPGFRGVFFRRTYGELKGAGGVVDLFKEAFGDIVHIKISDSPRFTSDNGSYIEARQISDEDPKKITETFRGLQADCLTFEELTTFEWYTFMYIMTRARGRGKWTGKVRATLNPKRSHWTRKWLDWYIKPDGFPDPEKDGVVRYFFLRGEKVGDLVWGDTKEEVYKQCKPIIDRQMEKLGGDVKYQDMIKSFTFYKGSLSENKALLENNRGYVGNVAAVGEKMAQALIEGNFNIDLQEDAEIPISYAVAESVFLNDPRENNDMWITADLADTGTDNTIILVWNGLHIIDMLTLCTSTPRVNADKIKLMAEKWDIPDSHIIYDGIRAVYINDYIPEAQPFISYRRSIGKYGRAFYNLKDECYERLVHVIRRGNLSFSDKIANSVYQHINLSNQITVKTEFIEECSVVRFKEMPGGRKTLINKKEMNQMLGKGRSMDLLDPIAMRMYPLLDYEYGQELIMTSAEKMEEEEAYGNSVKVYNDNLWC